MSNIFAENLAPNLKIDVLQKQKLLGEIEIPCDPDKRIECFEGTIEWNSGDDFDKFVENRNVS